MSCFEEVVGEVEYLLMLDRGRKEEDRGGACPTLAEEKVGTSSGCNYRWQGLGQGQGQEEEEEEEKPASAHLLLLHNRRRNKTTAGFLVDVNCFEGRGPPHPGGMGR